MDSEGNGHVVPLDEAAIEMIAELDRHQQVIQIMLAYIIRREKLEGQWAISANRRELVKVEKGE